jgi:hypothetical protein
MYDGRRFISIRNSTNGEVSGETLFDYHQVGQVVWATYSGGPVAFGTLIATVGPALELDMRYQHVNRAGQIMTGICHSVPETLPDGRLRLHETWQWTSGDLSKGRSVVEEVATEAGS